MTIDNVADSVFLSGHSNQDLGRYRVNFIHDSNNNNFNDNADGFNNLGDDIYMIFSEVV